MNEFLAAIPWPETLWSPVPFILGIVADRLYLTHKARSRTIRSHQ